jgi:hypothetical protein
VRIGLQVGSFTWPGGPAAIAPTLGAIARTAEDAGFDSLWVMDHLFQIRVYGEPDEPMLEGIATVGWLAARTERIGLGLMVGAVHHRPAGVWLKATTTLDVLSGGRAWFGIGAAWNEEESEALGVPMPPLGTRFEQLEETLRLVHAGWSGDAGTGDAVDGTHLHATRVLNVPQSLSRPRPPILVGGGGERRTLRLVARYADACNVFGTPDQLRHKYAVLREHCEREGRDYGTIERTNLGRLAVTADGADGTLTPSAALDRLAAWGEAGSMHAIISIPDLHRLDALELLGRDVIPHLRSIGEPTPARDPALGA